MDNNEVLQQKLEELAKYTEQLRALSPDEVTREYERAAREMGGLHVLGLLDRLDARNTEMTNAFLQTKRAGATRQEENNV